MMNDFIDDKAMDETEECEVNPSSYGLCWYCQSNLDAEGYCDQCELNMDEENQ